MKHYINSLLFLIAALLISSAHADNVILSLEYLSDSDCDALTDTGTWTLYAEVEETGSGADGRYGISAVRAIIDNVDPEVTLNEGLGAIFPIDLEGNPRPPVLMTESGALDILYGQDLSESEGRTVVPGVGVGGRDLIAEGTYSNFSIPTAGVDDHGMSSSALLLNTDSSPFGSAVDPDATIFNQVVEVVPECFPSGDFDGSGSVGNGDLTLILDHWGKTVPPYPMGWVNNLPTAPNVGNDDLTRLLDNWGSSFEFVASSSSNTQVAIPEPSALAITILVSLTSLMPRRAIV